MSTTTPWGKRWESTEIEELKKFIHEGLSYEDIAQKLGRSSRSIEFKKLQLARYLYNKGTTIERVTELFKLSMAESDAILTPVEDNKKIILDTERKETLKQIKDHLKEIHKLMKKIDLD